MSFTLPVVNYQVKASTVSWPLQVRPWAAMPISTRRPSPKEITTVKRVLRKTGLPPRDELDRAGDLM